MLRKIIQIDEDKCTGCGLCVDACHEGALGLIEGKAKLIRDDYCDGMGDCLPECPEGAISFIEKECAPYDEKAVAKNNANEKKQSEACMAMQENSNGQWPIQIKLAPVKASQYDHAHLVIAADCTAFTYANFHKEFREDNIILVGCPKLDNVDYSNKLTEIFINNNIDKITVVKMQVPCCMGLSFAVQEALSKSKKSIPLEIITVSTQGVLLNK